MKNLIDKHGGSTAVSRKVPDLPLRNVERWKAGKGLRCKWVYHLLKHWLENPPKGEEVEG